MPIEDVLRDRVNVIKTRFLGVLDQRLTEFREIRLEIDQETGVDNIIDELRFGVHKILGVASTLGFDKMGLLASATISEIDSYDGTSESLHKNTKLLGCLDALVEEISGIINSEESSP